MCAGTAKCAAEQAGNPLFERLGLATQASDLQSGGNMEGKETRFGVVNSALWATVTTAASNGSVNAIWVGGHLGEAALTATVISYRPRSALRDVGRALGIDEALISALSKEHPGMYSREVLAERLQSALARLGPGYGSPPAELLDLWMHLSSQIQRFPRHLSQHVGGFVLTQGLLTRLVPVENAAMPERSIIQWDKDDLDAVGLLKVDVLALGMLSAIRRCLHLVGQRRALPPGQPFRLQIEAASDGWLTLVQWGRGGCHGVELDDDVISLHPIAGETLLPLRQPYFKESEAGPKRFLFMHSRVPLPPDLLSRLVTSARAPADLDGGTLERLAHLVSQPEGIELTALDVHFTDGTNC